MYIFKTSAETYESVIDNKKHAFKGRPKDLFPGDTVLISKNKKGLKVDEKQISYYGILSAIRETTDEEIDSLWPGNKNRWKYITDFAEIFKFDKSFNLEDIIGDEKAKHYSYLMTHGKIKTEDEIKILDLFKNKEISISADELTDHYNIKEGSKKTITVNAFERDPRARKECLNKYGFTCQICGFDFEKTYGTLGKEFIHVHHIVPLFLKKEEYIVNPILDLIPVCPNCHAMLHKTTPPLMPNDLKEILNVGKN